LGNAHASRKDDQASRLLAGLLVRCTCLMDLLFLACIFRIYCLPGLRSVCSGGTSICLRMWSSLWSGSPCT